MSEEGIIAIASYKSTGFSVYTYSLQTNKMLYSLSANVNNNGLMYKIGSSAGTGWRWFNNNQDIVFSGIPLKKGLQKLKLYISDINGNVVEKIIEVWGI